MSPPSTHPYAPYIIILTHILSYTIHNITTMWTALIDFIWLFSNSLNPMYSWISIHAMITIMLFSSFNSFPWNWTNDRISDNPQKPFWYCPLACVLVAVNAAVPLGRHSCFWAASGARLQASDSTWYCISCGTWTTLHVFIWLIYGLTQILRIKAARNGILPEHHMCGMVLRHRTLCSTWQL